MAATTFCSYYEGGLMLYRLMDRVERWAGSRDGFVADVLWSLGDEFKNESKHAGYGQCDYLLGVGERRCGMGCYDEPRCQTCIPEGGWPSQPGLVDLVRMVPHAIEAAQANR